MRNIFKYYLHYSKPHWLSGILVFPFFGIGLVLLSTIRPLYYRDIIDAMTSGVSDHSLDVIFHSVLALCVIILIAHVFMRAGDYTLSWFESKVLKIISNDTFARLQERSSDFFQGNFIGSLVTKARRFVRSYETTYDSLVWNIWFPLVSSTGILISLTIIAPILAAVFFTWIIIYVWITWIFIKYKRPRDLAKARQDSAVTGLLADTLTNFLNIKMFASSKVEEATFDSATQKEHEKRMRAWTFGNHQNAVQAFLLGFLLELGMMLTAFMMWKDGLLTVGTVVLVQSYMFSIFGQLWTLGKGLTQMAEAFSDAQEMIDIFEEEVEIQDSQSPMASIISKGVIHMKDAGFYYDKEVRILEKFDLQISSGEKIGLIGHSGAGKSTIVKLLLRFIDVTSGEILIDDQNIASITQNDLRRNISYVPQEPILFHRSLRENILYGNPDASEQELFDAARKAHAHDFITSLPEGYDTLVGERGIKLSGGERQRVAIARAMLKDAPILILDEATSALDSISERHIQEAFSELMKGRTTIVIAHRLSTVQKMDRIIVLADGAIVEEGSHATLLKKEGVYHTFWKEQAGGFIS